MQLLCSIVNHQFCFEVYFRLSAFLVFPHFAKFINQIRVAGGPTKMPLGKPSAIYAIFGYHLMGTRFVSSVPKHLMEWKTVWKYWLGSKLWCILRNSTWNKISYVLFDFGARYHKHVLLIIVKWNRIPIRRFHTLTSKEFDNLFFIVPLLIYHRIVI